MKILLAVDGSDASFDAVRAVGVFSRPEQICVANVVHLPHLSYPLLGPNISRDLSMTIEQAMNEEGEHILDRAVSLLPLHHGQISKRLLEGTPAETLLNVAKEIHADVILIGARGLGQIREHFLGSVSHRIVTHAPCSTLVVKAPLRHLKQVLIPIESEEDCSVICNFLSKKPLEGIQHVTTIHVVPFSEPVWPVGAMIPEDFRKEMLSHAKALTDKVVASLKSQGLEATATASMGTPSHSIVREAQESQADLIIMRSHSRSGASRFLLGSVSHSVLHHAPCSVLLVR